MKKVLYEVWARPGESITDETKRLFQWYQSMAENLGLESYAAERGHYMELVVYIKKDEDMITYDTLYREYICHPERSEYYG